MYFSGELQGVRIANNDSYMQLHVVLEAKGVDGVTERTLWV